MNKPMIADANILIRLSMCGEKTPNSKIRKALTGLAVRPPNGDIY